MDCTVASPHCAECKVTSESWENGDRESAPSSADNSEAVRGNELARKSGEMETEQDFCELFCRRGLHLTSCDRKKCMELEHRAGEQYSLMDGTLLSRAFMVVSDEHTKVVGRLCSLIEPVWTDEQRVQGLRRPSVKVRLTDTSVHLGGSQNPRGD